jgi:hypothetical protein
MNSFFEIFALLRQSSLRGDRTRGFFDASEMNQGSEVNEFACCEILPEFLHIANVAGARVFFLLLRP